MPSTGSIRAPSRTRTATARATCREVDPIFGGSAWQWGPRRGQYYLHNFLVSQLNYHNPALAAQMLEECEFGLKRGVDGFRLDAINFRFHDTQRALIDRYPQAMTLGEIASEDSIATVGEYTADDARLHPAYCFELLLERRSPGYWPTWTIGNHDVARIATRWACPGVPAVGPSSPLSPRRGRTGAEPC